MGTPHLTGQLGPDIGRSLPAFRVNGYKSDSAAAEAMRKKYAAELAKRSAVVETGWVFVRTPQTPLPVLSPYTDH